MFVPVPGGLRRIVSLLLAALIASAGLVLAVAVPSYACKCARSDAAQRVERADVIFTATIDDMQQAGANLRYSVTAARAFKGEVARDLEVRTNDAASACGLGRIEIGTDYIFYASGADTPYTANSCSGSGPLTDKRLSELVEVTGEGTPVAAPEPPKPTMSKVEESPPLRASRLAAPGAALVLLGVLGYVVLSWRSRS